MPVPLDAIGSAVFFQSPFPFSKEFVLVFCEGRLEKKNCHVSPIVAVTLW